MICRRNSSISSRTGQSFPDIRSKGRLQVARIIGSNAKDCFDAMPEGRYANWPLASNWCATGSRSDPAFSRPIEKLWAVMERRTPSPAAKGCHKSLTLVRSICSASYQVKHGNVRSSGEQRLPRRSWSQPKPIGPLAKKASRCAVSAALSNPKFIGSLRLSVGFDNSMNRR
jgi:hypothetical protein